MPEKKTPFRPVRRSDRAIDEKAAMQILQDGKYGVLSTADESGQPYGIPVNHIVIGNSIYFHSAMHGHKIDNIRMNSRVSFCVVGANKIIPEQLATNYESVVVFGVATRVSNNEKRKPLEALIKRFAPDQVNTSAEYFEKHLKRTAVIKIDIEHVSGKARNE
ncbi:MAG: pyridoxamine 5'-phosphate oxidase family protein [Calditrichaeota bacterium]|nr:MAG: pyridoxamine 5'-phosphate oxidase family protein [Calditrichota bacterium]